MKEVARPPRAGVVAVPAIIGTDIITRQRKEDLLAEVRRGSLAGEYGGVSPVRWSGTHGVYAVKVERLKPAPVPPPAWHRTLKIATACFAAILAACSGAALAVGYLLDKAGEATSSAAKALPDMKGVGAFVLIVVVVALLAGGGKACTTVIKHYH